MLGIDGRGRCNSLVTSGGREQRGFWDIFFIRCVGRKDGGHPCLSIASSFHSRHGDRTAFDWDTSLVYMIWCTIYLGTSIACTNGKGCAVPRWEHSAVYELPKILTKNETDLAQPKALSARSSSKSKSESVQLMGIQRVPINKTISFAHDSRLKIW